MNAVGRCILPQLMKYRQDARMFKRLYIEQGMNYCAEKQRSRLERLETGYYAGLVEWITDNIFLKELTTDELRTMTAEFSAVRQRQYKELLRKREELRTLAVEAAGKSKVITIY